MWALFCLIFFFFFFFFFDFFLFRTACLFFIWSVLHLFFRCVLTSSCSVVVVVVLLLLLYFIYLLLFFFSLALLNLFITSRYIVHTSQILSSIYRNVRNGPEWAEILSEVELSFQFGNAWMTSCKKNPIVHIFNPLKIIENLHFTI